MEHTAVVNKNRIVTVYAYTPEETPSIFVYKLDVNDVWSELIDAYSVVKISKNLFRCSFTSPDEDCILAVLFGGYPTFVRVGDANVRFLYFGEKISLQIPYTQKSVIDGSVIDAGVLTELSDGFYFVDPVSEDTTLIEITHPDGSVEPFLLKLPYGGTGTGGPGSGVTADFNFLDEGYNFFAFMGAELSAYDIVTGEWRENSSVARAADLAKAVSHRYSLIWDKATAIADNNTSQWIGSYLQYMRTWDEEVGKIRNFVPGVTPEDSDNNFQLIVRDEYDNPCLRGIQLFITKGLTTKDTSVGLIFDFR